MRNLSSLSRILLATIGLLCLVQTAATYQTNRYFERNPNPLPRPARWGPPMKRDSVPLVISNNCAETIWPGIGTQAGTGAGTGGFELASGDSKSLTVSADWQGRVWGRTNCSFNVGGTGASNLNGNDGSGAACDTGDCGGVLSCVLTVRIPPILIIIITDMFAREPRQSHWLNLISREVLEGHKFSTTFPLSTAITCPSKSFSFQEITQN